MKWRRLAACMAFAGFAGTMLVIAAGRVASAPTRTTAVSDDASGARRGPAIASVAAVIRVIDGDTFVARIAATERKVRIIGIDAPETVDPRRPAQCFGSEASARLRSLLDGKRVRVEGDPSQSDEDAYGRLLRYVSLDDGNDAGLLLIRDGYAREYAFRTAYARRGSYVAAESAARTEGRGLWSPDGCAGKTAR